jgi:mannonate dehydratase
VLECTPFSDAAREVFPGAPEIRDGAMWASDQPGWGVDVDEEKARNYPWPDTPLRGSWAPLRRRDGTILRQ